MSATSTSRPSSRRTIEPTLLQGMLVCQRCGYAYYRTSTRTSKRKLHYYRCLGSDDYRYPQGRVCENRPVRQDYLDALVWDNVLELLQDPMLFCNRADSLRRSSWRRFVGEALRMVGGFEDVGPKLEAAELPVEVEQVLAKMLAPDVEQRYPWAGSYPI